MSTSTTESGADAHDAAGFSSEAGAFAMQGYSFVAQYIDQSSDANTAGSPSITAAQVQQETAAGLKIMSIFQTNGMSSSTGSAYQTYFTAAQGASDAAEAVHSAQAIGQPAGSAVYFAMDFDPASYGSAGSEANLLTGVQSYLTAAAPVMQAAGYTIGVYGAGDTLAAAIHNTQGTANYNPAYTPVAQYGWLTQSYGWAGSNPQTDANAQGWNVTQGFQTTVNGVAIDPDTASSASFGQWSTVCFTSGTLIRTPGADVAVEHLRVGDLVQTASGAHRPIKWIGHRHLLCTDHPWREEALPVRIVSNALGHGKPERDLLVSPGHALCVDVLGDVLVPAGSLINGATVYQEEVDEVTYWHVELDSHDILVANGLAAESYQDVGNRSFFLNAAEAGMPDLPADASRPSCCPRLDDGPIVEALRGRMRDLARDLGWTTSVPGFADVHLVADGVRIDADRDGMHLRFFVPASAREVFLASETEVPRNVGASGDRRRLGVCIGAITVFDGLDVNRRVALDDPALDAGFHDVEPDAHRWTNGRARLPETLWDGCRGSFFLRVDLARATVPRWVAPLGSTIPADVKPRLSLVA